MPESARLTGGRAFVKAEATLGVHPLHPGAAACFAGALTLSLYVPEVSLQRALQTLALAALLPSLGLTALLQRIRRVAGHASYRSVAFFGVLVSVAALLFDPALVAPFTTPRNYFVLLASAAGLVVVAAQRVLRPGRAVHVTWIEVLLAAALLWGLFSNPRWLAADEAIWFWVPLALLVLTFVTRQLFAVPDTDGAAPPGTGRRNALFDLFTALWINGVACALLGLRQALAAGTFQFEAGETKTPLVGTFGPPNAYGSFLALGIIGALVTLAHVRSRFARALLAGAALLQLGALVGNGSRGALLGLFTAAVLLAWNRAVVRRPRPLAAAAAALAVLLLLATTAFALYRLNPDSGRGRLQAWAISAAMAREHPLRGVGAGRYGAVYPVYQAELWREPEQARWAYQAARRTQPHSEIVHVLAERGVPGALLFAALWLVVLASQLRAVRAPGGRVPVELGLLALLVAVGTHAAVDTTLHWVPTALALHLALGLVAAPALLRPRPGARGLLAAVPLLALALLHLFVVGTKTVREYGAYAQWRRTSDLPPRAAAAALAAVRARLPGEAGLDLQLGEALLEAGQPVAAIAPLERALARRDYLDTRLALAHAYLGSGRLDAAERHARAALASFPDRLRPQLTLARVLHAAGNHEQARAALARCIRRETRFGTAAVDAVAQEAIATWRSWYADEPPR